MRWKRPTVALKVRTLMWRYGSFEDKYLNTVAGTIVRINERIARIDRGDGTKWRVGFGLLRHVLDI
jgi:hypothetical protein